MSLSMLVFNTKTFADEETLSYPFNADSGRYWQYVSDRVMGGVSDGQVSLEQDGDIYFARLTGNVSTANNGGFIQLRASVSFANSEKEGKNLQGVRLRRGNGETTTYISEPMRAGLHLITMPQLLKLMQIGK